MIASNKITARDVHQVCVVVEDLQAAMERYWNLMGIGPWVVYTFEPPALTDMTVRGKPVAYSMRLALAMIKDVQWELIQPLTGPSIYREFLDEHGEGVQHVSIGVDDYDETIAAMHDQGIGILMGGCWNGATFAYMDTKKDLGVAVELYKLAEDYELPPPEATYPPTA